MSEDKLRRCLGCHKEYKVGEIPRKCNKCGGKISKVIRKKNEEKHFWNFTDTKKQVKDRRYKPMPWKSTNPW
jgi:predicted nucleic acid binding AN1-type Zn finger protein